MYAIIIISLLAIDVTHGLKACVSTKQYESGSVKLSGPCVARGTGDDTRECCFWETLGKKDWLKLKCGAKWAGTSCSDHKKAEATAKCEAIGRPLKKIVLTGKTFEYVCEPVPQCYSPSKKNGLCSEAVAQTQCQIRSEDKTAALAMRCHHATYEVEVKDEVIGADGKKVPGFGGLPKLVIRRKSDGTIVTETKRYVPYYTTGEVVCSERTWLEDGSYVAGEELFVYCVNRAASQKTLGARSAPATLGHYDYGNGHFGSDLFGVEIAIMWLLSIALIGGTCFCLGAAAFYAVQWISKEIKK